MFRLMASLYENKQAIYCKIYSEDGCTVGTWKLFGGIKDKCVYAIQNHHETEIGWLVGNATSYRQEYCEKSGS